MERNADTIPAAASGAGYTRVNLEAVEDSAAKHGFGDFGEARFATGDLEAERTGVSFHRVRPGRRQSFGHRHEQAEEVYVVISGSGRVKIDDEIVELAPRDAIRVSATSARCFEAGEDGMEMLAVGARHEGDGEILPGWWS
ncbi:cupin domain-containing protein [Conexibacter arvalis]|uniref:Putative cupin superfamily protein n=1 Tax=Conexibacter arvalis TaxID=912552 RepID=A0A840IC85_9ACTN|nr:cupin domain-containing protein [Conexibacter arvalis]MBB4661550.1 putative cupin superfamily protein [Conexibacter arvalis]